jgi:AcrR family transcriptional regulator
MFAELGYDRTTIRAVASAAGVDAGLVMHYFGTKDELFSRAAKLPADELPSGTAEQVADALLTSLATRLNSEPVASLVRCPQTFTGLRRAQPPAGGVLARPHTTPVCGRAAALPADAWTPPPSRQRSWTPH